MSNGTTDTAPVDTSNEVVFAGHDDDALRELAANYRKDYNPSTAAIIEKELLRRQAARAVKQ